MHALKVALLAAAIVAPLSLQPLAGSAEASPSGTTFYIDNRTGSNCSDSGPGTNLNQPWCDFAPANAHGPYSPGDSILLARGATWNQYLDVSGSGAAASQITLGAYGAGANPRILRNQGNHDMAVKVTNPDYWRIEHLEVGSAANGILVYYSSLGHHGLTFTDIYAHDNKGVWGLHTTDYPRFAPNGSEGAADPWAVANNIVLSAGILVTVDPTLHPSSSSDYAASDIKVIGVRGSHNVNTVEIAALNALASGTDYSTGMFANVDVSLVQVDNDDGNAAPAYQSAELGCPDSIRFVGVSRAIMHDSYMDRGAACHTRDGTAGIFLAFIKDMTMVNNTLIGVPNTNSNDQTALDLEWHEDGLQIRNNFFAANAGAGLEMLNIHPAPADVTKVDIIGNTFSHNNWARTVADASIHQLGSSAVPVGTVKDNLYTEPGQSFIGGNIGGLTISNNISLTSAANFAADEFSAVQGKNQWNYQFRSGTNWLNLPTYSDTYVGGAWQVTTAQWVGRSMMAPTVGGDVARVWTAPYGGIVSIRGRLLKADIGDGTSAGNGITGVITKTTGGGTTQVWPAAPGPAAIPGADQVGVATDLDNISVNAGDQIRFAVGSNGSDNAYDTASWTPSIGYTASGTTRAWEFNTRSNFEGWVWGNQASGEVVNGSLTLNASGADPNIYSPDALGITAASGTRYLRIRLRNTTNDPLGKIYFTTAADPNFTESKSVQYSTSPNNGGFENIVVDMGSSPLWSGTVQRLRFDPVSTTGTVIVDSIRLTN